jgi:Ni/Co efflux regulator RcnB
VPPISHPALRLNVPSIIAAVTIFVIFIIEPPYVCQVVIVAFAFKTATAVPITKTNKNSYDIKILTDRIRLTVHRWPRIEVGAADNIVEPYQELSTLGKSERFSQGQRISNWRNSHSPVS